MFEQYDVVRINRILKMPKEGVWKDVSCTVPKVGDVATIIEIYTDPIVGYELECSGSDGTTNWIATFNPKDIELVKV